jgi:GTP-binding protein EngB required for normal cell division
VLAVVGEFSSGKSFLLNALLGTFDLLATDINPSTATITELAYAAEPRADAIFADGRTERIPLAGLHRFVAVGDAPGTFHDATLGERHAPSVVRIGVDAPFLKNGFVVVDTPGLASVNPEHRRATLNYLPRADAVLYLIDTQQPFTDGDAALLGLIRRSTAGIFVVQTKIDLWRGTGSGRAPWEAAAERIAARLAEHAPGTPLFPISAREYADGRLGGDEALVAQSRFPALIGALDAALVASTGNARLQRAAAAGRRAAARRSEVLELDAAALASDPAALRAERAPIAAALVPLADATISERAALLALADQLRERIVVRGAALRDELARGLARAFDITDIARLRDPAKLHIVIDAVVGGAAAAFADEIAAHVAGTLRGAAERSITALAARARTIERLAPAAAALAAEAPGLPALAARAFDAEPESGSWALDPADGVRGTILLDALGGPATELAAAIARRFAAARFGTYMKRELIADMSGELASAFDVGVERFVADVAGRVVRIGAGLADEVADFGDALNDAALGAIERALAVTDGSQRSALACERRDRAAALRAHAERMADTAAAFAHATSQERSALQAGATPATAAPTSPTSAFDRHSYARGLRPERWRVVVLGAFKRGKSSLINALGGSAVLPDEDGGELRFPVHVRYGAERRVFALADDGRWEPRADGDVAAAAQHAPVLLETPWNLPPRLVLVHAPAFDAGIPLADEIVAAAAAGASEMLALFSRQLADRELAFYARLAGQAPLTFVHTLADVESPDERRSVVRLAQRYLREHRIPAAGLLTVSTRSTEPWNELPALRERLTARAADDAARSDGPAPPPARASLLARILGRHR